MMMLVFLASILGTAFSQLTCGQKCESSAPAPACACGLDFANECMATCNQFELEEINVGTCDDFLMGDAKCWENNRFANWYSHAISPEPPCNVYGDGVYCVLPSALMACAEHREYVCAYGNVDSYQISNPCFARALGFTPCSSDSASCMNPGTTLGPYYYNEGPCDPDSVYIDGFSHFFTRGDSPEADNLLLKGGLSAYGILQPNFNESVANEDICDCTYDDYEPVCLKTGVKAFTFYNQCFLDCRKTSQSTETYQAQSQVYFPKDGSYEIIQGECKEACAVEPQLDCDEGFVCSSVSQDHSQCVQDDSKACWDNCLENEGDTKICVRQWLMYDSEAWFEKNKCQATECYGFAEEHMFEGNCRDRCFAQDCTDEQRAQEVCVYNNATGTRETASYCKATCDPYRFEAYVIGACSTDDCVKNCPIVISNGGASSYCAKGEDFWSQCEAFCAHPDLTPNDLVVGTCPPTPQPADEFACDADETCCDKYPEGQLPTTYGTCTTYNSLGDNAGFCGDSIKPAVANELGVPTGTTVKDVCIFSCGACDEQVDVTKYSNCIGTGSSVCCDELPADGNVNDYGNCDIYAGDYKQYCAEDPILATLHETYGESAVVQDVCKSSCGICSLDCVDQADGTLVSQYGDCASYKSGGSNAGLCDDQIYPSFSDGKWNMVKHICKVACGTCDVTYEPIVVVEGDACEDQPGDHANMGTCDTYVSGGQNYGYCEGDEVVDKCPASCLKAGCEQEELADCVDDPSFDIGYGDCSTYALGGPNSDYCGTDKLIKHGLGGCPISCKHPDCAADGGPKVCVDSTEEHTYGTCASYGPGEKNDGFCDGDNMGVWGKCPVICQHPDCSDVVAAPTQSPEEVFLCNAAGSCCNKISEAANVNTYGGCKTYDKSLEGDNRDYCSDLATGDFDGESVFTVCAWACRHHESSNCFE